MNSAWILACCRCSGKASPRRRRLVSFRSDSASDSDASDVCRGANRASGGVQGAGRGVPERNGRHRAHGTKSDSHVLCECARLPQHEKAAKARHRENKRLAEGAALAASTTVLDRCVCEQERRRLRKPRLHQRLLQCALLTLSTAGFIFSVLFRGELNRNKQGSAIAASATQAPAIRLGGRGGRYSCWRR